MIRTRAPEKSPHQPDMQTILRDNPWLIDPGWDTLKHERSLDKIVEEYFENQKKKSKKGQQRLDIFCLRDSLRWQVVEVKRPGDTVGEEEIEQARGYVFYLREYAESSEDTKRVSVDGVLIASKISPDARRYMESAERDRIYVWTWDRLWRKSEQLYGEFLELTKSKAPADDPRIQALDELDRDEL
jgi:RecB family endonuclease NucS